MARGVAVDPHHPALRLPVAVGPSTMPIRGIYPRCRVGARWRASPVGPNGYVERCVRRRTRLPLRAVPRLRRLGRRLRCVPWPTCTRKGLTDAKAAATDADLDQAIAVATRYAAVDTGAIEGLYTTNRGFTRTIATQAANWEAALAEQGDHVKHSIEDALRGYEMVMDAVTHSTPITDRGSVQLHEVLCASQETHRVLHALRAGRTSHCPKVSTRTTRTTRPMRTLAGCTTTRRRRTRPQRWRGLVEQLRSAEFDGRAPRSFRRRTPTTRSSACTPFADGNGRVARALSGGLSSYRNPGVPLVVFADQKNQYLDALGSRRRWAPGSIHQRSSTSARSTRSSWC